MTAGRYGNPLDSDGMGSYHHVSEDELIAELLQPLLGKELPDVMDAIHAVVEITRLSVEPAVWNPAWGVEEAHDLYLLNGELPVSSFRLHQDRERDFFELAVFQMGEELPFPQGSDELTDLAAFCHEQVGQGCDVGLGPQTVKTSDPQCHVRCQVQPWFCERHRGVWSFMLGHIPWALRYCNFCASVVAIPDFLVFEACVGISTSQDQGGVINDPLPDEDAEDASDEHSDASPAGGPGSPAPSDIEEEDEEEDHGNASEDEDDMASLEKLLRARGMEKRGDQVIHCATGRLVGEFRFAMTDDIYIRCYCRWAGGLWTLEDLPLRFACLFCCALNIGDEGGTLNLATLPRIGYRVGSGGLPK